MIIQMMIKLRSVLTTIIAGVVVIVIIVAVYYISYLTGGELTTAKSCIGSYIMGEIDIQNVKKECPNLSKENFIESINKYFDKFNGNKAFTNKEEMLEEINAVY